VRALTPQLERNHLETVSNNDDRQSRGTPYSLGRSRIEQASRSRAGCACATVVRCSPCCDSTRVATDDKTPCDSDHWQLAARRPAIIRASAPLP